MRGEEKNSGGEGGTKIILKMGKKYKQRRGKKSTKRLDGVQKRERELEYEEKRKQKDQLKEDAVRQR